MNAIKPLSCLFAIVFSAATLAKVTIDIPDSINMLVVNGEKPAVSGGFFSAKKTLTLEDGQQQIVFRYQPYFTQGNDRIQVESEVIVATFSAQETNLTFGLPTYRNAVDAENNIRHLTWSLQDSNGQSVALQQDRLIKPGMQIGRNYQQELLEYNRAGGPAAIVTTTSVSNNIKAPQTIDNTAEEMLYFWYNKADAATQEKFKRFINQ